MSKSLLTQDATVSNRAQIVREAPSKKALIIGATGATGKDLVTQLLADEQFSEVHIFARRAVNISHPKLHVHIVDFDKIDEWKGDLQGDVLFSALGTTLKQAGSQQVQWKIDYTYQYEVAKAAWENGVNTLSLVSAMMASADSKVFYSRMKGQLEDDVKKLGFKHLSIMRPPSLIRKDSDRFGEKVSVQFLQAVNKIGLLLNIRPMDTSLLAQAMIAEAKQDKEGTFSFEPEDIWKLINNHF